MEDVDIDDHHLPQTRLDPKVIVKQKAVVLLEMLALTRTNSLKLIRAFVFATRIVQFLLYLHVTPKFQTSSLPLWLIRPVCVRPVQKPHCWFSYEAAHLV